MIKIVLTGNIASGKSILTEIFEELGIKTISADKINSQILDEDQTVRAEIIKIFRGIDIISEGKIDKKKLSEVIFSDFEKRKKLEDILHPLIFKEIDKFFRENEGEGFVVAEVPLLYEVGEKYKYFFDRTILVTAREETRIARVKERNGFDDEKIRKIFNSQIRDDKKTDNADFVIENDGKTLLELKAEVEEILRKI